MILKKVIEFSHSLKATYLKTLPAEFTEDLLQAIDEVFEWLIPPLLNFVTKKTKMMVKVSEVYLFKVNNLSSMCSYTSRNNSFSISILKFIVLAHLFFNLAMQAFTRLLDALLEEAKETGKPLGPKLGETKTNMMFQTLMVSAIPWTIGSTLTGIA